MDALQELCRLALRDGGVEWEAPAPEGLQSAPRVGGGVAMQLLSRIADRPEAVANWTEAKGILSQIDYRGRWWEVPFAGSSTEIGSAERGAPSGSPRNAHWAIQAPTRQDALCRDLLQLLKEALQAGLARPTPSAVFDAWRKKRPPSVVQVESGALVWRHDDGRETRADKGQISDRLQRLTRKSTAQ